MSDPLILKISTDLADMKVTLARQHVSLDEHMRRTLAIEKHIELHAGRIVPLEAHVAAWAGVGKAIVFLGVILGAAAALWKMFGG